MPAKAKGQRETRGEPDDTTPHMNAHTGANHVTGFSNSSTADGDGNRDDAAF
jgi:hypothetical protein